MTNALLITLIGAGMVFIGLILLWWLMAVLVRLSYDKQENSTAGQSEKHHASDSNQELNRMAAAAAIAVAIAMETSLPSSIQVEDTEIHSPWKANLRMQQINQSNAFHLKRKTHL